MLLRMKGTHPFPQLAASTGIFNLASGLATGDTCLEHKITATWNVSVHAKRRFDAKVNHAVGSTSSCIVQPAIDVNTFELAVLMMQSGCNLKMTCGPQEHMQIKTEMLPLPRLQA